MAENIEKDIILRVSTDTNQAVQGVQQINQELDKTNNKTIDKPFKSFKTEIREAILDLKRAEEQFGKNSKQFTEGAKKVAELKDRFEEFNQSIAAFNPDNKFQALTSLAKGATGAIQGVAGGMTLLGIESENSKKTLEKLTALMNLSQALNSIDDIKNAYKNFGLIIQSSTAYQKLNSAAIATTGVVMKLFGGSVDTTSTSFKGLKTAIVATGIGALVIGIIALIQNFDKVKEVVLNLIPGLSGVFSFFGKLFNAITDFIGITNEADRARKKASEELEKTLKKEEQFLDANGYKYDKYTQAKIKADIDYNKKKKELLDDEKLTEAERNKMLNEYAAKRNFELDKADKERAEEIKKKADEEKKKADDEHKKAVEAAKKRQDDIKKVQDDYTQAYRTIADVVTEANNKILESTLSEKEKELLGVKTTSNEKLRTIEDTFKKEKDALDKALRDGLITQGEHDAKIKNLTIEKGKAINIVNEAAKVADLEIEKKYHQKVLDLLNEASQTEYEKTVADINKKYDELIKVANDADKVLLQQAKDKALTNAKNENTAKVNVIKSETNLIKTERENTPNENDTPEQARVKIANLTQARIEAENEAFEQKKLQSKGQKDELEKLEQEHTTNLTNITKTSTDARKQIADDEQKTKLAMYQTIGNAAGLLSDVLGKETAAGKTLASAQALINTNQGVTSILAQKDVLPAPFGFISKLTQIGVALKTGFDAVKNINSVKVPNGGGAGVSTPNISAIAPQLNAQAAIASETQNVRIVNPNQAPIKAYITNTDLQTNEQKTRFLNQVSTI